MRSSASASSLRLIWVVPKFPLGSSDGARHATCSLLRYLTQSGVTIDLVCLVPRGEPADEAKARKQLGVRSCSIIRRGGSLFSRFPTLNTPFTFRSFSTRAVRESMQKTLAVLLKNPGASEATFLVFDALHSFAALSEAALQELSAQCRGIVFRAHNVETVLWEQVAQKCRTPWGRWFFNRQAALVRDFEIAMARRAQIIAPVSMEDANKFKAVAPGSLVSVIPIGIDFPDEPAAPFSGQDGTFELFFIGRLDWLPNRTGLLWFLEKVWPELLSKRPKTTLKIAGTGKGQWLEKFRNHSGINLLGRVDALEPHYRSCTVTIAPLFQGSGTRVKILESARYARPVVSTALGAEGLGLVSGTSYFKAENKDQWVTLLATVTPEECMRIGAAAYQSARARFDAKWIAEEFLQLAQRFPLKTLSNTST